MRTRQARDAAAAGGPNFGFVTGAKERHSAEVAPARASFEAPRARGLGGERSRDRACTPPDAPAYLTPQIAKADQRGRGERVR